MVDQNLQEEEEVLPTLITLGLVGTIDTIFLLLTYETSNQTMVDTFVIMALFSWIVILGFGYFFGDDIEPLPFLSSPGIIGVVIGIVLGLALLLMNILVVSIFSFNLLPSGDFGTKGIPYNSMIFVPQFFSTAGAGNFSTLDNVISDFTLVGIAEEGMKAMMLYTFYYLITSKIEIEDVKAFAFSVVISIGVWASAHTILVHFSPPEVGLAFASGVIMFIAWYYTGSLITAVIVHSVYDGMISLVSGLDLKLLPSSPQVMNSHILISASFGIVGSSLIVLFLRVRLHYSNQK